MKIRFILASHVIAAILVLPSTAQTNGQELPVLRTMATDGIRIDGVLDEADWSAVTAATDFVNFRPTEGEPSSQRTEAKVLYGPNAIYVGAILHDTEPDKIRRVLTRRDESGGADTFLAGFDSYDDRKTAYFFGVTAAGVQFDGIITGSGDDDSWDAVWDSKVRVTNEGWVVEMAIPYSQLRFAEDNTSWGLEFKRDIRRTGEEAFWAPLTTDEMQSGIVQQFGQLEGLEGIKPRRAVQVVPYALSRASRFEDSDVPERATASYGGDVGADFKVGLSSNVTLDATINPDFGQVEADPAQLNLSTFETFFPEKRPFFLEGTQIFDFTYGSGDGALLYTRRVGGASPIVGATKLSGRLPSGLSFGVLGAATGEDFNPQRYYGASRVKQEFGSQNYIGGAVTGYAFSDPGEGPAVTAFVGGVDWDTRVLPDDKWKFEGSLAGSIRTIDDPALTDPTRRGYALYMGFDQVKGFFTPGSGLRIYSPDFQINDMGRFRQTNLIQGRIGANKVWNDGEPFGPFLRVQTGGFTEQSWRYDDRTNRGAGIHFFGFGQFSNFWSMNLNANLQDVGGFDVRETRGLGPIKNIRTGGVSFGFESDDRKLFSIEPGFGFQLGQDGARTVSGEFGFEWNASDRVEVSSGVGYGVSNNATRWTANEGFVRTDDGFFIGSSTTAPDNLGLDDLVELEGADADALLAGVSATDDELLVPDASGYYLPVFGKRDTRDFNWSTRANVIFTPNISLQLYGQLFAARGRFSDFSILANPDDLRPFDYPKRPDFSFQSFQANVVLRWEYRPGSTLFVVWTQSRNLSDAERYLFDGGPPPASPFDTTTRDQLRDTFRVFPENVFLIKLNYLLQR